MNPVIEPYYGTPVTLGAPPMILRDPSLRFFCANGVDRRYWYYDPPACCFCPRGGKYRLQGPRDGTKGMGRGVTYLSMKIVSRARRSLRDSNRHAPNCFFCAQRWYMAPLIVAFLHHYAKLQFLRAKVATVSLSSSSSSGGSFRVSLAAVS